MAAASDLLMSTRPTAVNLRWAVDEMKNFSALSQMPVRAAYMGTGEICDEDVAICSAIGDHGMPIIHKAWEAQATRIGSMY